MTMLCTTSKTSWDILVPSYTYLIDYLIPTNSNNVTQLTPKDASFVVQAVAIMQTWANLPSSRINDVEHTYLSLLENENVDDLPRPKNDI